MNLARSRPSFPISAVGTAEKEVKGTVANTYTSCLFHCVFSTKGRRKLLTSELREKLWPYMGGIARNNGFTALAVGGSDDHAHVLLAWPANVAVTKAVQLVKSGSSKWIHDTFPTHQGFAWQEGYGAFSIGIAAVDDTIQYINDQELHHGTRSFEEEYVAFLKRHRIDYDERYVYG